MLRSIVASLLLTVAFGASAYAADHDATANLNEPGALEAVKRDHPSQYAAIRQILDGVLEQPVREVPKWLETTFDARDVRYTLVLRTSYPPKKDLAFTLDSTRYTVRLTLTNVKPEILPGK